MKKVTTDDDLVSYLSLYGNGSILARIWREGDRNSDGRVLDGSELYRATFHRPFPRQQALLWIRHKKKRYAKRHLAKTIISHEKV